MASAPSSSSTPNGNPLLDQAQQWLNNGSVSDLLTQASPIVKKTFGRLTTTQKILAGAALLAGAVYFTRRGQATATSQGTATDSANTLHELLYFVNDRIEGYQRAADESQDPELRGYYKQLVSQSQQFSNELNDALRQQGGERQTQTTLKGKLYRQWMDAKAALTGQDEKAILGSNLHGEQWALKAYEDALQDGTLSGSVRVAVERQYASSQKTYDKLQKLEQQH